MHKLRIMCDSVSHLPKKTTGSEQYSETRTFWKLCLIFSLIINDYYPLTKVLRDIIWKKNNQKYAWTWIWPVKVFTSSYN